MLGQVGLFFGLQCHASTYAEVKGGNLAKGNKNDSTRKESHLDASSPCRLKRASSGGIWCVVGREEQISNRLEKCDGS
ncbi:hypothetical protein E2C01_032993 [Portunus trituberculatus]|uniref:Uncharacterized protein n=1 Tax=Portunus trituberculatus TaxID=210409 RepID=A0A5B7F280_PORTR|nr:hypothetical protein [Portunus trituberculatus]